MIKRNKAKAIISSLLILVPAIIGLCLWNDLPEIFMTHWSADGKADSFGGKFFAVVGIPFIMLAVHWICLFITSLDPKNKEQNNKAFGMVFWILPVITLFSCSVLYSTALGKTINTESLAPITLGVMFILMGNYLPKVKQNHTLGIKVFWAMQNEENWNKTHSLAGKLWVFSGLLLIFSILLPTEIMIGVIAGVIVVLVVTPIIYSYCHYKRQMQDGTYIASEQVYSKYTLKASKLSPVIIAVVIVAVTVLMFTGNIKIECGENSFKIEATYWSDFEIEYAAIDSIDYRENCNAGVRTNGFGSPRLSMGTFENDEFGSYTRYAYTGCEACIVMEINGETLIISGPNVGQTKSIYEQLISRIK